MIIRYLKPFIVPLIFAVTFLAVQAYGELALPEIMSGLVDVGISRSGIENAAPKVIRKAEMENLLQFAGEEEIKTVHKNYRLLEKENLPPNEYVQFIKKYPALANGPLYILDTNNKETISGLNRILGMAILSLPGATQQALPVDLTETALIQAASPYIISEYIAVGIDMEKYPIDYLYREGGIMILFAMLIMVSVIIQSFLAGYIGAGIGRNLRKDMFEKITTFSSIEFDKFSTASLITRSTNDVQQIQNTIGMLLRILVFAPIMSIGGIIKALNTEVSMLWIIALAVGILLIVIITMFSIAIPKFRMVQTLIDKVNLIMREALSGILVIRAFANQKHEENKFDIANKNLTSNNLFVAQLMSLMMPLMMIIMNGATLLILWVGAGAVDAGAIQIGGVMAFIQYAMQIIMSFLMISMVSMVLPRAMVSAKRISEVLSTENSVTDPENTAAFDEKKHGYIEFENVSFKYPGAEEYVIENITFTAKPSETTAIIGGTGSGKSTIVNLIPRFYDATEGFIKVDGADITQVKQHSLREKIGYVPQKGILFSGTIESNIKFADENIPDEDMCQAAQIAQATEFIEQKTDKYKETVAQGGSNVSGGQKQRLSIARALAKKPQIYIFDDSFSALDYRTDSLLRNALQEKLGESTVIIVAQRIGTIKNANKIIVLEQGQVAGTGTHKELLQNCEVYKQIALSQLSQDEIDRDLGNSFITEGGSK